MISDHRSGSATEPLFPVRVAVSRTGVAAHLLRAWERRYGAVEPDRSRGGQRRYSEREIERIRLLRDLVAAGHSIGSIARRSTDELRELMAAERELASPSPVDTPVRERRADTLFHEELGTAMSAVEDRDTASLRALLGRVALSATSFGFVQGFIVPLLRELGSAWKRGSIGVAEEHLASAVIREVLGVQIQAAELPGAVPGVVCTTPSGQLHEFGALLAALTAAHAGWRPIYAGPDLPSVEIARLAESPDVRAVALSVLHPSASSSLEDLLAEVRRATPASVKLYLGGHPAAVRTGTATPGFSVLESYEEFRDVLAESASLLRVDT